MKKDRLSWLRLFETQPEENAEGDDGGDGQTIAERIRLFIAAFPYQSARYKTVWAVRILCWALLAAVAVYGVVLRARAYFG